jgi:predicted secreted protein
MALAGHGLTLSISPDDSTYTELDGVNDFSFGPSRDMLETTDFKDTTGAKTRMAGLKDGTISISGDYESGDTAQAQIFARYSDGAACWIRALWDGAAGHKVKTIVESFELKSTVDGKVEFTSTHQFNGVFSAV